MQPVVPSFALQITTLHPVSVRYVLQLSVAHDSTTSTAMKIEPTDIMHAKHARRDHAGHRSFLGHVLTLANTVGACNSYASRTIRVGTGLSTLL